MIERVDITDFTIFESFTWDGMGTLNLIIGENDTGKSNLLKLLYVLARSLQESRPETADPWPDVLARKLRWTFQPRDLELGRLVRKGARRTSVEAKLYSGKTASFSFGPSTTKQIKEADLDPFVEKFGPNALFFPPKEVLTALQAIAATRERLGFTGFGDTYLDLIQALRQPKSHLDTDEALEAILRELDAIFAGTIEQEQDGSFEYRRGSSRFDMTETAEGIKKVGGLVHLLRNGTVRVGSTLFFDEPGAHLHPNAILDFVRLLFRLAQADVRIFIATHSYVVLKQFELLAREHKERVPLCVLSPSEDNGVTAQFADLQDRIPSNSIVDASVELFEREVDMTLAQ